MNLHKKLKNAIQRQFCECCDTFWNAVGRWDAGLNGLKAMHLGLREETQNPYRRRTGRCGLSGGSGGSLSAFQMLDLQIF